MYMFINRITLKRQTIYCTTFIETQLTFQKRKHNNLYHIQNLNVLKPMNEYQN